MEEKVERYFRILHPEYENLTPEERDKLMEERGFIRDHIDVIEDWCKEAVWRGEEEGDPRLIEEAIREAKCAMYIDMLYPDYSKLDPADKAEIERNKVFIYDHVEAIDEYYESIRRDPMVKDSDQDVLKRAMLLAKEDMYIDMLYPDYSKLDPADKVKIARNKVFIYDHVEAIDEYYESIRRDPMEKGSNQDVLKRAMLLAKVDMYIDMLYPDYSKLDPADKAEIAGNKVFIENHVDEIDEMYTAYVFQTETRGENINKQEIMRDVISALKTKQITPQQIGKVTINTPTTAKMEAKQVENGENTRDNIKEGEGEEVGDGN